VIKSYFEERGIAVNDDVYALSEMIQWIWRSGIRQGDPITVFVPSDRMRRLLRLWLDCDDTTSFIPLPTVPPWSALALTVTGRQ
jgi:hypothetical protein